MVELAPLADGMMTLRVLRVEDVAEGVRSFELARPAGGELPAFTAGAHLRVRTPGGALRKYSLCNAPAERERYVIAVKREPNGSGGSASMHDAAREGVDLAVSSPENAFPLVPHAKAYLFIAGGIGITPILSMIRSFGEAAPAPWRLVYLTRSPAVTAFGAELRAHGRAVTIHHDRGDPARAFDPWPLLERPNTAHVYCCGPQPLMDAVRDMTGHWSADLVHFESFVEGGAVEPDDTPFTVRLARSGREFEVPAGRSILATLREHGCTVASSCESGTCGTCRTGLVEGEVDHRDMVLLPEERSTHVMICVSRARSAALVLDL